MIDNLYILGAGASVDSGAPLMNNFLDVAEDLINEKKYRNNREIRNLFDAIRGLNTLHAKSNIDLDNIESVLGLLEMSELLEYPIAEENTDFKSLRDSYIQLLSETLELSVKYKILGERHIEPEGSYGQFADIVKAHKDSSAIISFNYDLGVDVALYNRNIRYQYYLDPNDVGNFPLLKLHGSLNWFKDVNGKVIPHSLSNFFKNRHYQAWIREEGILSFVDYINGFPLDYKNKTPFIVPPTWNKTINHHYISNVWRQASICLSEAKNIFVIGYSLPETDQFFKFLFSLGTNSPTRIRKFWVINPERRDTEERYRELLGPQMLSRFRYFGIPFIEALATIKKC